MSFRWQIYYNAVFGAIGGLLGWFVIGLFATGDWNLFAAYAFVGSGVGLFIGSFAGLVDGAIFKRAWRPALVGALTGGLAGVISGAIGLLVGELSFLNFGGGTPGRTVGWLLLGLFLGMGDGAIARSRKRIAYGVVGGALAGALGGLLYETMTQWFLFSGDQVQMIVGSIGLILIGTSLGSIIPVVVEGVGARGMLVVRSGSRAGLEKKIVESITIGSYDGCELYLPGDPAIDKKQAQIFNQQGKFYIKDIGALAPTLVNGAAITRDVDVEIKKGAIIRLGAISIELL